MKIKDAQAMLVKQLEALDRTLTLQPADDPNSVSERLALHIATELLRRAKPLALADAISAVNKKQTAPTPNPE